MLREVNTLHRPRKVYCGPYAIAALTGLDVGYIEEQINHHRGKNPGCSVRWVNGNDLAHVGTMAKVPMSKPELRINEKKTFARWLRERTPEEAKAKYLVLLTGHWIAVDGNKMIDTRTRTPTHIQKAPHRRRRVQVVIRVD